MPTEPVSGAATAGRISITNARILRLALGTALSLWVSQAVGWSLSYVAPIITMTLLAMPLSRPSPRFFLGVVVALVASVYLSFLFLPFLLHQELVGLLLVALALFHSFYFTARGGPAVIGTLVTIALALTISIGTVTVDGLLVVADGLVIGAIVGSAVAMLAHGIVVDPLPTNVTSGPADTANPGDADLVAARYRALRSLALVLPILLWFVLSGGSASNMAVMIKVAAMGQEVSLGNTRTAARSLIFSTVAGGIAAMVAWQLLSVWPSLVLYVLLVALAGLFFGARVFRDDATGSDGATWSYAYLTMIVVLAPAVLDQEYGSNAGALFYQRLFMFAGATIYGVGAVYVFDAFRPRRPSVT